MSLALACKTQKKKISNQITPVLKVSFQMTDINKSKLNNLIRTDSTRAIVNLSQTLKKRKDCLLKPFISRTVSYLLITENLSNRQFQ